jgi:hypothetical protein
MSPWSSRRMLWIVPLDTPMGRGNILAGDTPIFFQVSSNSGNNVSCPFGFPCRLESTGCQWFHHLCPHIDIVNCPGLVPISRIDGLFMSAALFVLLACNKVLHFCHSSSSGRGGINRLSTVWSACTKLGLRGKQLS